MVTLREVEKAIVKAWGVLLCLPEPQALLELGKAARPSKTWSLAVVQGGKWSWFMYVSVCTCVRVLHVYTCVPVCVTCVCVPSLHRQPSCSCPFPSHRIRDTVEAPPLPGDLWLLRSALRFGALKEEREGESLCLRFGVAAQG